MHRPFVAYLRVYEPLSAFDDALAERLRQALTSRPLGHEEAGWREQELWLRSQLTVPVRLLPGQRDDGRPTAPGPRDVLTLHPSDVIGEAPVGPGPLVCPLDIRTRAAAALVSFMSSAPVSLAEAAVPMPEEAVRGQINSVMAEQPRPAHVVSSTWTVPLPWFALVEPDARQLVTGGPQRMAYWRAPMADTLHRTRRAHRIVSEAIGDDGPARMLADTITWLEHFDEASAVELDYGGLVQLLDDDALRADTSATDVHAIIEALRSGDAEEVAERYERLRDFWGELAARERAS